MCVCVLVCLCVFVHPKMSQDVCHKILCSNANICVYVCVGGCVRVLMYMYICISVYFYISIFVYILIHTHVANAVI